MMPDARIRAETVTSWFSRKAVTEQINNKPLLGNYHTWRTTWNSLHSSSWCNKVYPVRCPFYTEESRVTELLGELTWDRMVSQWVVPGFDPGSLVPGPSCVITTCRLSVNHLQGILSQNTNTGATKQNSSSWTQNPTLVFPGYVFLSKYLNSSGSPFL